MLVPRWNIGKLVVSTSSPVTTQAQRCSACDLLSERQLPVFFVWPAAYVRVPIRYIICFHIICLRPKPYLFDHFDDYITSANQQGYDPATDPDQNLAP